MAASESTKFQVNFRSPDGTLINLYAASKEELEALLTAAQDFSTLITSVSKSFSSTGVAPAAAPTQLPGQVALPPLSDVPAGGPHACRHGAMNLREGVGAKGPWKGYMCPAPKGATDKCQTIWVK